MTEKAEYCVFVGRFQPFHRAHRRVITTILDGDGPTSARHMIIVVGSDRVTRSLRNPWSYDQRVEFIRSSTRDYADHITVVPLRDFTYSDVSWMTALQNKVAQIVGSSESVIMTGCFKDDTSHYLKLFPQWKLFEQPYYWKLNASTIRDGLFNDGRFKLSDVEPPVADALVDYMLTDEYKKLKDERKFLSEYKERWSAAPYPPTFVTTDAVLMQAGHVLLIRRGRNPGKGLLALPGGFIKQSETIYQSALRELREETGINMSKSAINSYLAGQQVFDHPSRDMRGRTITHAFYFRLEDGGPLLRVKANDDAAEAMWVPLSELPHLEDQFYSDHLHIIGHFIYK